MNAPDITFKVAKRFHELRRRYFGVRIGIGIVIAVIALLSVWMLLTAGDYVWEWALTWRKVGLLVGSVAACVWLAQDVHDYPGHAAATICGEAGELVRGLRSANSNGFGYR